jgi:hypothetical protein
MIEERVQVKWMSNNIAFAYTESVEWSFKHIMPFQAVMMDAARSANAFLAQNWYNGENCPKIYISLFMEDARQSYALILKVEIKGTGIAQAQMFTNEVFHMRYPVRFSQIADGVFERLYRSMITSLVDLKLNPAPPIINVDYKSVITLAKSAMWIAIGFVVLVSIYIVSSLIS